MINWITAWRPGCWCFDRRPIYSEQRPRGVHTRKLSQYDFTHAWVWFLWAPRDEACPHAMPHAWGFANEDDWSLVHDLTGTDAVFHLGPGQADWSYLCDVLVACDDMAARVAKEIAILQSEERQMNLQRIADAFSAPESRDFQKFIETSLRNDVPEKRSDPFDYFKHGCELLRRKTGGAIERFDPASRSFQPWDERLAKHPTLPISRENAVLIIQGKSPTKEF